MMFVTPSEKQTPIMAVEAEKRLRVYEGRLGLFGPRVVTMYLKSTSPASLDPERDDWYVPHRFRHMQTQRSKR